MTNPNDDAMKAALDVWNGYNLRDAIAAAIAVLRPAIRAEALREALDALWSGPRYDRDVFDSMTKTVDGSWLHEDDINRAILALIDKEKASD